MNRLFITLLALTALAGCAVDHSPQSQGGAPSSPAASVPTTGPAGSFASDVAFLHQHGKPVVLSDREGKAMLVVSPAMQGRVLTSTSAGPNGTSYGWINRELIESGKLREHINAFGGEDRLWLGPEGGQFSIFFAPKVPFDLAHWFTPAPLDTEPFEVVRQSTDRIKLRRSFDLTNYSGTKFNVRLDREVALLPTADAWKRLGVQPSAGLTVVGFESVNRLTNAGRQAWTKETGALSIWILGMMNAAPATTIVIPVKGGDESELGKPVNSDYFGPVPAERLVVKGDVVYFKADAKFRSKIGVNPRRAKPILGSYDADKHVLTLVQFTLPAGRTDYVNSAWKLQEKPFAGDVANAYNDGPPPTGEPQLGQFYELESSSPAAALAPGESTEHVQRTFHLQGPDDQLDKVSRAIFGVGLDDIRNALPK